MHGTTWIGADLLVLCAVAVLAYLLQWSAGDLAWSIWLASLVLSTTGVLAGALGLAFAGATASVEASGHRPSGTPWLDLGRRIVAVPAALFAGAAFAFAFVFLHALYAMVLYFAFPLLPDVADAFALGSDDAMLRLLATAAAAYWPFVVAAALTEARHFARAIAIPAVEHIGRPVGRVFRMHAFMFVAVAALLLGGSGYFSYLVTLTFFFLPWGDMIGWSARRRSV